MMTRFCKPGWPQFSLASMLLALTILCCFFGALVNRAHRQREAVAALRAVETEVIYADESSDYPGFGDPPGPKWLREWAGIDFVADVWSVEFAAERYATRWTDREARYLRALPGLRRLVLAGSHITDAGVREIARLRRLTGLYLDGTQLTDAGVKDIARLQGLSDLSIGYTRVTDVGVKEIVKLGNLSSLDLAYLDVSDAGLTEIARLEKLSYLGLEGTRVTDVTLKRLGMLEHLSMVSLANTRASEAAVRELERTRPRLKIYR